MLGLVYGKLPYTKETHRTKIGPFEMETFPSDQRLDPNLVPCVAWRCPRVERAMGIVPRGGTFQALKQAVWRDGGCQV